MASWSAKRRWSYISIIAIVVIVLIVIPGFFTFYKAPTCFDGVQNQGEQGIDCGGPCQRLCQTSFIPAQIVWSDAEEIAPGVYNLAAYIENPNTNGAAINVPFTFSVYDVKGSLITSKNGSLTIPAGRNVLAFVGDVNMGSAVPAKNGTIFQLDASPLWVKAYDNLSNLTIGTPKYQESNTPNPGLSETGSAVLQVPIGNKGLIPYEGVTVFAVLSDKNGNHVGFSQTLLTEVPAGGSVTAPFTWPFSFNGRVVSEEILPVVAPTFSS